MCVKGQCYLEFFGVPNSRANRCSGCIGSWQGHHESTENCTCKTEMAMGIYQLYIHCTFYAYIHDALHAHYMSFY